MKLDDMTTALACEAAGAYQAAKGSRQCMYQLAKAVPDFRAMYEDMQAIYVKLCGILGVPPEPVFDMDEYKKSDRYCDIMEGRIL